MLRFGTRPTKGVPVHEDGVPDGVDIQVVDALGVSATGEDAVGIAGAALHVVEYGSESGIIGK